MKRFRMIHPFYIQKDKLLTFLAFQREQYPDLLKMENFHLFVLVVLSALKGKPFTTFWTSNGSTMVSAWSWSYLNQEKAYATL